MAQTLNQFEQSAERGQLAMLNGSSNAVSAMIDSSVESELKAGDAVKLVSTSKGFPKVAPVTAEDSAAAFFFILFNPVRNAGIKAGDRVELLYTGGFMYMRAGGAINAGARVAYDTATGNIKEYASGDRPCGLAMDAAGAEGDLVRVFVQS